MDILSQFITRTPLWVWVLLVYLLVRGIKARQPGDTTLLKTAVIPVLFTVWSLSDLTTIYGVAPDTAGIWLLGMLVGAAVGWSIVARYDIVPNRAAGTLHRPADNTLLPLLLLTFAVKYGFGVVASVSPDMLLQPGFRFADLGLSGLFTGIFIGKFARYVWAWNKAPAVAA